MVGKTQTLKEILKWKHVVFVKQPDHYVYVSPNLKAMHLPHERQLTEELTRLAAPTKIDFLHELPSTVDEIMEYAIDTNTRTCWLLDDFNDEFWNSSAGKKTFPSRARECYLL